MDGNGGRGVSGGKWSHGRNTGCLLICFALAMSISSCGSSVDQDHELVESPQQEAIDAERLGAHVEVLASDEFQGRQPLTIGEEKTLDYLEKQAQRIGLVPTYGESYEQIVPLIESRASPDQTLTVAGNNYLYGIDYMATAGRIADLVELANADVVFVGYGINAPEYEWNDYEGLNVKGKVVLALVNDPGFATRNEASFEGQRMTYYGRPSYKYEEAARQGAVSVFVIHEEAAAGYPWMTIVNGRQQPKTILAKKENEPRLDIEGWISTETARKIFRQANLDFDEFHESSAQRSSSSIELDLQANLAIRSAYLPSESSNFVASVPGKTRADEHILYMAHWDHLGVATAIDSGDNIYNGARDNALGVAALLELARKLASVGGTERSQTFIFTTSEESGLLGAQYYTQNPLVPIQKTVAAFNFDSMNISGQTRDVSVVGYGKSELEEYLVEHAEKQGRVVIPEPTPERGYFYRGDHFSLAKAGIPTLKLGIGIDPVDPERWNYLKSQFGGCAHKVCDEYSSEWDLSGAADDLELIYEIGFQLGQNSDFPNWYQDSEFRKTRDDLMPKPTP